MNKVIVTILLAVTFFLPFFSAQNFSPASDEITHLPSGYSYWKTGQITLNPQHPPFVKLISSFPLLFMDLKFNGQDPDLSGPFKNEWTFGKKFMFSNDADRLLFWGRLPIMLLSVLLGFYIYRWASEMFGSKAGLLSLFLYAFMPNIIAHAQFVTTDLALTSFSFVTFYYLWKFFKTNLKKHLIYSGLFLGLALSSKFSAVLFFPIILFLVFVYAKSGQNDFNSIISKFVKITAIMIFPAFLIIYFSYLMPTDTGFYLKGLSTVYADWEPDFKFYLNGEFSKDGWWYYFLEAFLIKTPIPALIAFMVGVSLYRRFRIGKIDKMFIFLPIIFFTFITILKAQNVGIRYLMPTFPFLILYTGGLADIIKVEWKNMKSRAFTLAIIILTTWLMFSSLVIYPDYVAYFNELVGGPKNGYKYLDDSNVEWGQDLKRARDYQIKNPDTKVVYSWSKSDPTYYGIENLVPANDTGWWRTPKGLYAVNTFLLIRMQLLSQTRNDPSLNWLALYKPADRIGYSFFVYEFK